MSLTGSCLCGDVRFEVEGPLEPLSHCHCSMCRKAHGAAFASFAAAPARAFRWLGGTERIRRFESSPGALRPFCSRCGSTVPMAGEGWDRVFIPLGLLDGDPKLGPLPHIFVGSKAPWYEIHDATPQYDAYPPGMGEAIPSPRKTEPTSEAVRGSCLCGAVAYEIPRPVGGAIVLLSLHALPALAGRGAQRQPVRRARALPLAARRGQGRVVQAARRRALHASVLPRVRRQGAGGALPRGDPRRDARRRSRDPPCPTHLRGVEGALVRDRRRPAALRRVRAGHDSVAAAPLARRELEGRGRGHRGAPPGGARAGRRRGRGRAARARPAHRARADRRARRPRLLRRAGPDRGSLGEGRAGPARRVRARELRARLRQARRAAVRRRRRGLHAGAAARPRPPGYANR